MNIKMIMLLLISAPVNMLHMAKYYYRKLNFSCGSALSANFVKVLFDSYLKYVLCVKRCFFWGADHALHIFQQLGQFYH